MKYFKVFSLMLIANFEIWTKSTVVGQCSPLAFKRVQNIQITCLDDPSCNQPGVKIRHGSRAVIKCRDHYETRRSTDGRRILTCNWGRWEGLALVEDVYCKIKCGRSVNENPGLAVKGMKTERLKWPWHIALFINDAYACGGSIINPYLDELVILTAVHCTIDVDGRQLEPKMFKVVIGAVSSNLKENARDPNTQILNVKQITRHDNYDLQRHLEDIALLDTDKPIKVTPYSLPVCLPLNEIMVSGQVKASTTVGTIVGFGSTSPEARAAAEKLHTVQLPVVSTDTCHEILNQRPISSQICAGTLNGPNACSGDSGGGLIFKDEHPIRYFIQGIVSSAPDEYNCDGVSIFTKVFPFLNWIEIESERFNHADHTQKDQSIPSSTAKPVITVPTLTTTARTIPTTRRVSTVRTTPKILAPNSERPQMPVRKDYEELAVKMHNELRRKHQAQPVSIDPELTKTAQKWADHLTKTDKNLITGAKCSENLFEFSGTHISPTEAVRYAVDYWYSTKKEYNPKDPKPSNFTQLVWKSSNKIGVGVSRKGVRTIVTVCYSPTGNLQIVGDNGQNYRNNVSP